MHTKNLFAELATFFQTLHMQEESAMHNTHPTYTLPNQRAYKDQDVLEVNGTPVPYRGAMRGSEIVQRAGARPGRRVVKVGDGRTETIDLHRVYGAHELTNRYGESVQIKTLPERTKGGLFSCLLEEKRSKDSKRIIMEQVQDVAQNFGGHRIDFDNVNADWVVFSRFRLPQNWSQRNTALMILFPVDYPLMPPIGFYLPESVDSPHGHKYGQAYHGASDAPIHKGWDWYCCTVDQGAWQPALSRASGGWRRGDNLWDYITLINEVLGSDDE